MQFDHTVRREIEFDIFVRNYCFLFFFHKKLCLFGKIMQICMVFTHKNKNKHLHGAHITYFTIKFIWVKIGN